MSLRSNSDTNLPSPSKSNHDILNHSLNPTVLDWDMEQVALWVGSLGLGIYSGSFKENDITGDVLIHLDHADLSDIGVKSVGHRLHILKAVYHLVTTEGLKLDHCYTPPSVKILQDQGNEKLDFAKILHSFELRDERIALAEQEIKKSTENLQRLRQELLPIFKLAKESKPLPTPDSSKSDQPQQLTPVTLQQGFPTNLGSDIHQNLGNINNALKISGSIPLQHPQQLSPSLTSLATSPVSSSILTQTPPSGQFNDQSGIYSTIEQQISRSSSLMRTQYPKSEYQNQTQTSKTSRNPPLSPQKRHDNLLLSNNIGTAVNINSSNNRESVSRNLDWQHGVNLTQMNQNFTQHGIVTSIDTTNNGASSKLSSISLLSEYSSKSSPGLAPTPTSSSTPVDTPTTTFMPAYPPISSPVSTINTSKPISNSTSTPSPSVYSPVNNSGIASIPNLAEASTESLSSMLPNQTPPAGLTNGQGTSSKSNGSGTNQSSNNSEPFKSFRVTVDDPCYKVLPAALKRYKINADYRQYALLVCYNDQERVLGLQEKPLRIFKELQDAGKNPVFMLRMLDRRGQAGEAVNTNPGGVL